MESLQYIYDKPSVLSRLFATWPIAVVRHHRRFGVSAETMPDVPKDLNFDKQYREIVNNWNEEQKKPHPSFFKAVWKSRRWEFILYAAMRSWLFVFQIIQSVILYYFVLYLKDSSAGLGEGCLWGTAFLLNQLLSILIISHATIQMVLFSSKLKSWSCMLIAEKLLTTSNSELNSKNQGTKAINIIGNDLELLEFVLWIGNLFALPVIVPLAIAVVYVYIGFAGVLGILLIASHVPLMVLLGKVTSIIRVKLAKVSDARVKLISNLIEGIKVIKLYAWEQPLLEAIFKHRASEIRLFLKMAWSQLGAKVLNMGMIATSFTVTLLYFVHQGNELTPEVAFLCVGILNAMNSMLNYFSATGLRMLFLVLTSFRRITEVLLLEDAHVTRQSSSQHKGVKVRNASFTWGIQRVGM